VKVSAILAASFPLNNTTDIILNFGLLLVFVDTNVRKKNAPANTEAKNR